MPNLLERNELGQFVKGYKFTEEERRRISEILKGNKRSVGRKHSKETLKKMSESHNGHPTSEKTKRKIGFANSGERNYRWIKDRSILEKNKRNDPEYKQWVKKVKRRDNNTCRLKDENCFGYNIAHHIKNWSEYPELRYKVNYGITLCQAHHPKTRVEEKRLEPVLMALVLVSSEQFCQIYFQQV